MDLLKDVLNLGIQKGDKIVVHSSLSSIGSVEGGAEAVCKAFMNCVGTEGIVIMPALTFEIDFQQNGSGIFDVINSKSRVGAIPECFRKMKGVLRSYDPTHSFCVWGGNAIDYVATHHLGPTMDYNSPLALLEKNGGKAVLINCFKSNTFHHVVEMTNSVKCLSKRGLKYPARLPSGKIINLRAWVWRNGNCQITDDNCLYYDEMKKRKQITVGMIGEAETWVFTLSDCRNAIEDYLNGKIEGFIGCKDCNVLPLTDIQEVESDWDDTLKRIKDNSEAYKGEYEI